MFKFINCLFNYGVVLLLGVVSLIAGRPLVYRCFLGLVDTKDSSARVLHNVVGLLQNNVNIRNTCLVHPAPALKYYTNKDVEYYTKTLLPATTPKPRIITLPQLTSPSHHMTSPKRLRTTPTKHRSITLQQSSLL
jgi:hypothetical protein